MSEQIKYEAVFGDQSLFNGMPDNTVLAVCDNESKTYYEDEQSNRSGVIRISGGYARIAMRRIIRTPIWTMEDQKAGKLPEVGAKLIFTETWDAFEFVGVIAGSMRWACKDFQDGFIYFFEQSEMSPIESPEEKAARLRSEWCNRAMDYSTIQQLYDAMLSGELKMPDVQK